MKAVVPDREPTDSLNPWKIVCLFLGTAGILTAIGVCLGGCSLARYTATPESVAGVDDDSPDPCESLDNTYIGWTITAGVAGAGATGTIAAAAAITDHDAIVGLTVSSVALAAIATGAGLIAAEYAARYEACRNETQGEW